MSLQEKRRRGRRAGKRPPREDTEKQKGDGPVMTEAAVQATQLQVKECQELAITTRSQDREQDFGRRASGTVGMYISAVLSHPVFASLLRQL